MAINKTNSPMWVKVVLIVLIVAFVALFVPGTLVGLFSSKSSTTQQPGQLSQAQQINQQFQGQVDALAAAVASDPTSYTALVSLGNAYFDWGVTLQNEQPQGGQAVVPASQWLGARTAYERALKVKADDPAVLGDYSVILFYSGETTSAISTAEQAVKIKPDFAVVWLNLGNFYRVASDGGDAAAKAKAIAAYQQYLKLDPNGQQAQIAKDALKQLGAQ